MLPLLREGVRQCPADGFVFPGAVQGRGMSTWSAGRIVRTAGRAAGLALPLSGMLLRHSFAVHALERRENVRALQETLGHQNIKSTLVYARCLPPEVDSPLDRLPAAAVVPAGDGPPPSEVATAQEPVCAPAAAAPAPAVVGGALPPVSAPSGLFGAPPDPRGLRLPFAPDEAPLLARTVEFGRLLRTRLANRFLAFRRAYARGS